MLWSSYNWAWVNIVVQPKFKENGALNENLLLLCRWHLHFLTLWAPWISNRLSCNSWLMLCFRQGLCMLVPSLKTRWKRLVTCHGFSWGTQLMVLCGIFQLKLSSDLVVTELTRHLDHLGGNVTQTPRKRTRWEMTRDQFSLFIRLCICTKGDNRKWWLLVHLMILVGYHCHGNV